MGLLNLYHTPLPSLHVHPCVLHVLFLFFILKKAVENLITSNILLIFPHNLETSHKSLRKKGHARACNDSTTWWCHWMSSIKYTVAVLSFINWDDFSQVPLRNKLAFFLHCFQSLLSPKVAGQRDRQKITQNNSRRIQANKHAVKISTGSVF